jgi:phosphoglycerate dehydrogenase-like enzyme
MSSDHIFRVGISPDWGDRAYEVIGSAIERNLAPLPNLEYEIFPASGTYPEASVIDRYDALIVFGCAFPGSSFEGVERLVCLSRWGAGFDNIDVDSCTAAGVVIAITPAAVRRPVAEGVFTLIFALAKRLLDRDRRVRDGRWRRDIQTGICIQGRTLGSIGAGNIAAEVFSMARGLGFGRLLACDPLGTPQRAAELGLEFADFHTILRESDFLTIHVPLNSQTRGMIDARALAMMKSTAFLINTARGGVVDQKALTQALVERRIAGAGLDVFESEPVSAEDPLLRLDNVVLSPHSISWTEEDVRDISDDCCRNVCQIYHGRPPNAVANPAVLQRAGFLRKLARRQHL